MQLNSKKTAILFFLLAVFLFICDRYLKFIALNSSESTNIIGEWLKFNFAKNYYIAFSIPIGGPILEIFISLIICVLFYVALKLAKKGDWLILGTLTIIIFGAISNLLDRFIYSFVIDYIDLKYFTIFNIADSMIVVSACLLLLINIKENK